jgi:seryl-tRNA synthetase
VSWFRRVPQAPPRQPHPDGRTEAELQRVLALQRAAQRTEDRIEDIRGEQKRLGTSIRKAAGSEYTSTDLREQARVLRGERRDLEAQVAWMHAEITRRLAELGDGAVYL